MQTLRSEERVPGWGVWLEHRLRWALLPSCHLRSWSNTCPVSGGTWKPPLASGPQDPSNSPAGPSGSRVCSHIWSLSPPVWTPLGRPHEMMEDSERVRSGGAGPPGEAALGWATRVPRSPCAPGQGCTAATLPAASSLALPHMGTGLSWRMLAWGGTGVWDGGPGWG